MGQFALYRSRRAGYCDRSPALEGDAQDIPESIYRLSAGSSPYIEPHLLLLGEHRTPVPQFRSSSLNSSKSPIWRSE